MPDYEQLSLAVDPELEKIYTKLLRKELEHPENWTVYDHFSNEYCSPTINDGGVFFVTAGRSYNYEGIFYVYQKYPNGGQHKIHEIKLTFWDFKTPKMLRVLHYFMPNKEKWVETQNTTKTLKSLLGIEFDRYAKIMKIKKKI